MDKLQFVNSFNLEHKIIASNIYDKIRLASITGRVIYSDEFYPPNVWNKTIKIASHFGIFIKAFGIFEESERRMLAFSNIDEFNFPCSLLRIQANTKYNVLSHKDFLGAIMALGVERNKFGDLVVNNDKAYIAVSTDILEFIKINLCEIGKGKCEVSEETLEEGNIPKINFQEIKLITTSLRLDCIVSSICNLSRSKALELIASSKVQVDYNIQKDKALNIFVGSTISIRGYGKYKVVKVIGNTGRDRIKLLVKKFI